MEVLRADPLVGRVLDARYDVSSVIARGGMATVYAARDTRLDRMVAVKVMHPFLADDPDFVARFTREARAAARISDRNVVAVYDQGSDPATTAVYLVMELVQGRTVRSLLDERGLLSPPEALEIVGAVASALRAAHDSGVVHRDVKPENVLLGNDGRILVADFGLARAVTASPLTAQAGLLMGTVAYLAPEQVRDGSADQRSDVYAAGVLLFELLCGHPPYQGDNALSVAYRHLHEDVPPTGVDPRVDALLLAATARDPAMRPRDGADLAARVHGVARALAREGLAQSSGSRGSADGGTADGGTADGGTTIGGTRVLTLPDVGSVAAVRPTSLVPGPRTSPPSMGQLLEAPPTRAARRLRQRRRRWPIVALLLALLTAAAGAGGWWYGVGRYSPAPKLLGLSQGSAVASARGRHLDVHLLAGVNSDTVPLGVVLAQDPEPGARTLAHAAIALRLSLGPLTHSVPALSVGTSSAAADTALVAAGLAVGHSVAVYDSAVASGDLIRTVPAAGVVLRHGTAVELVLSKGPQPVPVPTLRPGELAISAEASVRALGLVPHETKVHNDTFPLGEVIEQTTTPGSMTLPGGPVNYEVSLGPLMLVVPQVVQLSPGDATTTLQQQGFTVVQTGLAGGSGVSVVAQSPRAGTLAAHGSSITIYTF